MPRKKTTEVKEDHDKKNVELDYVDDDDGEDEDIDTLPALSVIMPNPNTYPTKKYKFEPTVVQEEIIIAPDDRITSEVMTSFERANVIAVRAKQLEDGGHAFIDIGNMTDYEKIAEKEIDEHRCPLSIKRHITDNIFEIWNVNDMASNAIIDNFDTI